MDVNVVGSFTGRVTYNVLDLRTAILQQETHIPISQFAEVVLKQTEIIFQGVPKNTMFAYINVKAYYDKKANTSKLKEQQYRFVLQRKADDQGSKTTIRYFRWIGLYIVEKALPSNKSLKVLYEN